MAEGQLRIGVTGHRRIEDAMAVGRAVDGAIDEAMVGEPVAVPVAVSSLAEGADRLVAERVLARPGGRLEVILPLAADDYADDFGSEASRAVFADLLARAADVAVVPTVAGAPREAAYEAAGLAMVGRVDVLLALWDGQPSRGRGGTAEIVAAARAQACPVVVIPVDRADP